MNQLEIIFFATILVILLLLAAFFASAETALMAINRYRLKHHARTKKRYATHLLQLLKRPDRLLGAILIGSTFANMLASSLATLLAFHFWGNHGAILAATGLTIIVLIFVEIMPKTVAATYPDQVARWAVHVVRFFLKILYPAVWLANSISNGFLRLFRVRIEPNAIMALSREELRSLVYDTSGKMPRQYHNMLLGILDLSKLTVDDVMVLRHDMHGIDIAKSSEQVIDELARFNQDWMPVYRENLNQLVGVLYTRDVMHLALKQKITNVECILPLLRDPYFVPEGTSLNTQLNYFQQTRDTVAFVVDEYGDIKGLLTLNDILEEIVGDFTSNLTAAERIRLQSDNSYLVDGVVSIREFNRKTGSSLPVSGPRTINGLIIEFLEALPHSGTTVLIGNYPIEILQVKNNRVIVARVFPKILTNDND